MDGKTRTLSISSKDVEGSYRITIPPKDESSNRLLTESATSGSLPNGFKVTPYPLPDPPTRPPDPPNQNP